MSETTISTSRERNEAIEALRRALAATGPLLVLLLLILILWILSPPFRSPTSLMLLALEAAAIGVVAAGQTFVILTGGIDLSVEAMVSFAGVTAAILIAGTNVAGGQIAFGIADWQAVLIAITAGLAIGMFQGLIITGMNMNPLIVTLGFRSMLLGISLVWTRGAGINIQKGPFLNFVTSTVDLFGLRVPMPFIIVLGIYFLLWIVLKHTKFGRYTYAIGGNETATRLSGINVDRVKVFIYGISGLLAAIGGILVMARLQSGAYQNGTNMTLISVAAVVIGGTALSGGVGGIWGTLIGVFIIRIVEAGLVYMSVPSNAKEIVIGAIIVLAVALDVIRRGDVKWLRFRRTRA
ncbi:MULTISPECIES: ABC transporter permease [Caldilinea]|jgi:ribose transport system permease protein|uniref:Ribose ABC transporter permease protein n=1 Tax=Caldilinea aerophila (strain DSM 14535 / JCM 11387 / NBRC 104270 / STL-6-O1) TaxID=926550 RepID=I0I683_CALAS|nr:MULTISPECIES: ABC transporter permease [Caldilinea]BAM00771.1 ribose ABC transporter permease protein [Caldilinea aerophila DSM 14535 = NBRC 104270]GIV72112.1 MAG: ribose import permease protein RbsC [Caldilinea sp.]